ncbi:LuxR family two component transcriptional regulator [Azonexus fungiphilus]|uniref:LuxR family two component transcriptional regulator n=1 Tax=Azonexus fungiphilus TaxID=146940 RepID=A0A495WFX5_9RHOO|nr:response regulator transcription factor [Azonexus fungiphilus]NHC05813.1 response regulator transcription factor [Azonexus fungiphilus]RKT60591.1 LuxR family two component transcriptional regulator [Azonexus fungiphilus]
MNKIRIVLADDQLLVRAGIRALLETLPGYAVAAECADGHTALAEVERHLPDVVLLDIAMPGPSGIEIARMLRQRDPTVRILILSSIDRQEVVEQALEAGVNGYLLKDFVLDELQQALSAVLADESFLSPKISDFTRSTVSADELLTPRQTEILRLVANGRTTKEIGRTLGISPKTVEFHRARLMQRIGVHDVTGLTRYAVQHGLVS